VAVEESASAIRLMPIFLGEHAVSASTTEQTPAARPQPRRMSSHDSTAQSRVWCAVCSSIDMQNDDRRVSAGRHETGTDDRADRALPVTAEVGSEGGSFADPTTQIATFERPLDRVGSGGGDSSVASQAIRSSEIAEGGIGAGPDPSVGIIRYPSEDPSAPARPPADVSRRLNWRGGLIGAAAGLAGAALVGGLSRRRR
jgi:hypothetical protein